MTWAGNYNTTAGQSLADHCRIQSIDREPGPDNSVYPNATCKCATSGFIDDQPKELEAFGCGQPNAVTMCICDPTDPEGEPGADGLIVPSANCWCPSKTLAQNSGLTDAKEAAPEAPAPPAPEAPAPVDAAAVKKCRDDFFKSLIIKENACSQLLESPDLKFTDSLQRNLPSCTPALLAEVCKTI
ncbi:hypothetical protein ARSEF1564_007243 [Beauveria bassiana]